MGDESFVGFATGIGCLLVDALITWTEGRELDGTFTKNARPLVMKRRMYELKLIARKERV